MEKEVGKQFRRSQEIERAEKKFLEYLEHHSSTVKKLIEEAEELRQEMAISLPRACCSAAMEVIKAILGDCISEAVSEKNLKKSTTYEQLYDGACSAFSEILFGEAATRGNLDETILLSFNSEREMFGNKPSILEDSKIYINLSQDAERAAELLRRDPTGFTTIRDYRRIVRKLKVPFYSSFNPGLAEEGAEFAEKVYKTLYNLARKPDDPGPIP